MRRRSVLQLLAAGATAAVLSPATSARASTANDSGRRKLRIAIVGLGGYARYATERLLAARRAELAGFVTGDAAKGRDFAGRFDRPQAPVYSYEDFDRLAADERIDAVHLCLPVGLHAEYAERALVAGKHVLCEKPLAATSAEARRVTALARERSRLLMPAYRAWYSGALQAALGRVRGGEWGRLVAIDAHKGFPMALPAGDWRFDPALAGGGALFDIGPYSVQLTRWAAGSLPARVRAIRRSDPGDPRFARVESHLAWLMEFPDGAIATGSASWRYHLQNHARFGLERAWLRLEPATPGIGERLFVGAGDPARVEELLLPIQDQLPRMYDDFAEAALTGGTPQVSAEEGIADLVVLEALARAAAEDSTVEVQGVTG